MIPDWQLPRGVDRGLHDYFHADDMVQGYDAQMNTSALARTDVAFCERHFRTPGKLIDLGCGTGRLAVRLATLGHTVVGVDLSEAMLNRARANAGELDVTWLHANIIDVQPAGEPFDYAACLFSTWGMIRTEFERQAMLKNVRRLLKPGGVFVLHAHHRRYRALGWRRILSHEMKSWRGQPDTGDITMPQAYGGAALTLHHTTARLLRKECEFAGFTTREMVAVDVSGKTKPIPKLGLGFDVYGYLVALV